MLIDELFNLLDDWRHLPAYQLERRADIFFALHLKQILEKKFQVEIDPKIIPEFPIRKGNISGQHEKNNQSFKVDYLAITKDRKHAFLIELKTDMESKGKKQELNMVGASDIKLSGIIDGLLQIIPKTRKKSKYHCLMKKVEALHLIKKENGAWVNLSPAIKPSIVYILPENEDQNNHIISFTDIIEILKKEGDPLTKRFLVSLEKWKERL